MRVGKLALTVLLAGLVAACASSDGPEPQRAGAVKIGKPYQIKGRWYQPSHDPAYSEVGIASWYGAYFHGRPTANGERFDKDEISAAHKTLPLPSIVRVTNLENGRSMEIRVNDRGPFVDERIIDLSEGAAEALGFRDAGLAEVRVEFVRLDGELPKRAVAQAPRPNAPLRTAERPRPSAARPAKPAAPPVEVAVVQQRQATPAQLPHRRGSAVRPDRARSPSRNSPPPCRTSWSASASRSSRSSAMAPRWRGCASAR